MLAFFKKIANPSPLILDREIRQKSFMLNAMLLCSMGGLAFLCFVGLFNPGNPQRMIAPLMLVIYVGIFALAKTKYFRVAGHIWLSLIFLSIPLIVLGEKNVEVILQTSSYLLIGVLICSIILTLKDTIFWVIVSGFILAFMPSYSAIQSMIAIHVLGFVIIGSILACVASYIQNGFVKVANAAEKEADVQRKNAEKNLNQIEGIFASMQQGIFTVGPDLKVGPKYSAHLSSIFENESLGGLPFEEMLFTNSSFSSEQIAIVKEVFKACIGADSIAYELNEHLLPRQFTISIGGKVKVIESTFSPIMLEGVIQEVLVILRDVTQLEALKEANKKQNAHMEKIFRILKLKREDFESFTKNSMKQVLESQDICKLDTFDDNSHQIILRYIHTIKGNSRMLGLADISEFAHHFEDLHQPNKIDRKLMEDDLKKLESMIVEYQTIFVDKFRSYGPSGQAKLPSHVQIKKIAKIAAQIEQRPVQQAENPKMVQELAAFFESLCCEPLSQILATQLDDISNICLALKKDQPKVEVVGGDTLIPNDLSPVLKDAFLHLIRNSIDHGLEDREERIRRKKSAEGLIKIECLQQSDKIHITFSDDGYGLNFKKILNRALDLKLIQPNESSDIDKVLNLVFFGSFSTRETVTTYSGRGVGLNAVKKFIEENDGKVLLEYGTPNHDHYSFKIRMIIPSFKKLIVK